MSCDKSQCWGEQFVYLAYLDDSGTKQKNRKFQVLAAVLIKDNIFREVEAMMGMAADGLVPEDKLEKFEEFHAFELYGGYGVFDGIDQTKRFGRITAMLEWIQRNNLPICYGAVNIPQLQEEVYGSANPVDIAFRLCATGINSWLMKAERKQDDEDFTLFIADESDSQTKNTLRQTFRQLRKHVRPPTWTFGKLWHVHDDMYFGSSKDSVGIQIADLCAYFIAKHLEGTDPAAEGFYEIIKDQIVHCKVVPE